MKYILAFMLTLLPVTASAFEPTRVILSGTSTVIDGIEIPDKAYIYLDMSVGATLFQRDSKTKEYDLGFTPGAGYGIRFCPAFWTLTPVLFAVDLFVQALVVERFVEFSGPDYLTVDVIPVATIADWVSIGYGLRTNIALHKGVATDTSGVLVLGIQKSL